MEQDGDAIMETQPEMDASFGPEDGKLWSLDEVLDVDEFDDDSMNLDHHDSSLIKAFEAATTSVSLSGDKSLDASLESSDEESEPTSYCEKVKTKAKEDCPKTIAEKLKALRQVDMDGLEGKAHYYETVFSMMWNSAQGGKNISKAWVKAIVDTAAEMFQYNESGLCILPLDEKLHKKKKLWIQNEVELRAKIKSFRNLQRYIDLDYSNAQYMATNNKAGKKLLQTRMCFGFNFKHQPEEIMKFLHKSFCEMGPKAGCYRSPVQFGKQVRIGFLCYLI